MGLLPVLAIFVIGLFVVIVVFLRPKASGDKFTSASSDTDAGVPTTDMGSATAGLRAPGRVPAWAQGVVRLMEHPGSHAHGASPARLLDDFSAWMKFNMKGKELGFAWGELQLMYRTAIKLGLERAADVLWSAKGLDHCLQAMFWHHLCDGSINRKDVQDFLYRLMQYRQGMELGRPRRRRSILSTRSIEPGQAIKIMVPRVGMFISKVLGMDRGHLEIDLPRGRKVPGTFSWKNSIVEVYFWRKDDAGYFFETKVLNSPDNGMHPTLNLLHSEFLIRTQKRTQVRLRLIEDAWIAPLQSFQNANEIFDKTGSYLCRLLDISMSGAAVLVRGVLEVGFLVKLQTRLGSMDIVLCGEIKAVNVNMERRFSVLHIEAVPPSKSMRMRILSYVLGVTRVDSTLVETVVHKASPVAVPAEDQEDGQEEEGEQLFEMPSADRIERAEHQGQDLENLQEEKLD